ncbi:MAG: tRNA 5-methylaminomethyl-2-thiouridine biosynthesis bifunctional protein MnmC [Burkholderiales bacterium]|nr:MAG: tRNA 5-methylaminomethyl-2-thiouridine biosynthesis bifunctional protein MnmC [Burkholderiales bacterium]
MISSSNLWSPEAAPVVPARVRFGEDGAPFSLDYDDVYYSASGGLAETVHVFLQGNGLPARFRGAGTFTIVETGFGTGLNFLATWDAWRASAPAGARLHFVSVEKHPLTPRDLEAAHRRFPELAALARALIARYPPLLPGFHRRAFEDGRVTLTLCFGEAATMLSSLEARADAFYLDGFAPAKNPRMWSEAVFRELTRLAAPGATAATYTVAGEVRRGLAAAGFEGHKRPGFGRKREMLAARFASGAASPQAVTREALVIGAGLAGTGCAERLAARGFRVSLVERHPATAREASANPAGVLRPAVSPRWNPLARFTCAASGYAWAQLEDLAEAHPRPAWAATGALQLPRGPRHLAQLRDAVERLPADFARLVDGEEGARLVGAAVNGEGVWYSWAGWARGASVCEARLAAAGERVLPVFGQEAVHLVRRDGCWQAWSADGRLIAQAALAVLANGFQARGFFPASRLPLRPVRGQSTLLPERSDRPLRAVVCREGCITPAHDGFHCLGATFGEDDPDPSIRVEDHADNLRRLERMLPGYGSGWNPADLKGWVGFRPVSADRLPIAGALGEDLYVCTGLGARGLAWSALAGELVASQASGEPLPLERDLVQALAPQRFAVDRLMAAAPGDP